MSQLEEKFGREFKVGDEFEVVNNYHRTEVSAGDVVRLHRDDGSGRPFFTSRKDDCVRCLSITRVKPLPQFKPGDKVEMRDNGFWRSQIFVADKRDLLPDYSGSHPYVAMTTKGGMIHSRKQCRQPKPNTTITFADGQEVELSEQTYQALRGEQ